MQVLPTSRLEAKAIGSSRYFTGRPCKRDHIAFRWTAGARCAECNQEWLAANNGLRLEIQKRYYRSHREEKMEAQRKWRRENPGKFQAQWRRHDVANRETNRIRAVQFYRKNPERVKAIEKKITTEARR